MAVTKSSNRSRCMPGFVLVQPRRRSLGLTESMDNYLVIPLSIGSHYHLFADKHQITRDKQTKLLPNRFFILHPLNRNALGRHQDPLLRRAVSTRERLDQPRLSPNPTSLLAGSAPAHHNRSLSARILWGKGIISASTGKQYILDSASETRAAR